VVIQHWSFDPYILVVAVLVGLHELGLYRLEQRFEPDGANKRRPRSLAFYSGLALLLLAVTSPLDYWADKYFYVHMVQHILIMFFAPILIVIGEPWLPLIYGVPSGVRRVFGRAISNDSWARPLRSTGRLLSKGWVAVVVFNVVMVMWHIPVLLDLAVKNEFVRIWLMHSSFFLAGVFFWLQVIPSFPFRPTLSALGQIWAILTTNIVMIVLAMAMSIFSNSSWFSVYNHVHGVTLSPFADQQIGAAILWVCGDFWAVPALFVVIRRAIEEVGSGEALFDALLRGRSRPGSPGAAGG
jgi:cytochrome c oxidase assembly factor CtaG